MLLTAGFFVSKIIGVDFDPLQDKNNYGMCDEQEKCFALQKGLLNQHRFRTWSKESKHGRMFLCFVGLILASYVRHIWEENEYLRENFDSTESIWSPVSQQCGLSSCQNQFCSTSERNTGWRSWIY